MRSERTLILNDAGRQAIKSFRDAKPWKGTLDERGDKFAELHRGLIRAYDMETMLIRDDSRPDDSSANSGFDPRKNHILLVGRLSVVTYLYCFAVASGLRRRAALSWARETFRHFFPRSYAGCRLVRGMLVRE